MEEEFKELKTLVKEKFKQVEMPVKDQYNLIIREELVHEETGERNYEIGVGKTMKFPNKISINGKIYRSNELDEIKDGSVIITIKNISKNDDRHEVLLVEVPKALILAIDQASWDGKLKEIKDLIDVINNFDPSKTMFSPL
ncbi:hypothetical protein GF325_13150 [Candidatus Bathyarchaeota archaeon]|nr:hypothetical protein [Candidatus Bathyarchaeota archaeon]